MKQFINNSSFKTIVFDLNGTLASRVSDHPSHLEYRNAYIKSKTGFNKFELLPDSTSLALKMCGLSPLKYYIQRNNEVNWNEYHEINERVLDCISRLKNKGYNLVLYTDCHGVQVQRTLEILNLTGQFDLCITEEYNFKKPAPKAFTFIAEYFKNNVSEILMVGNDYQMDLFPSLFVGASALELSSEHEFFEVMNVLLFSKKLEENETYKRNETDS